MRKITLPAELTKDQVNKLIPRANVSIESVSAKVAELIEEVRNSGIVALTEHARRFDQIVPDSFRVPEAVMSSALAGLAPDLRAAIEEAIVRVRKVSQASLPDSISVNLGPGAEVSQKFVPVDSVGLYVPGGKAVYPSSVIMNAVPAMVAQVPRIAIASPAQAEFGGYPHPSILATAKLLGIDEVYAIGGASAVAAFAYGVSDIGLEPVRMVTGPGNIFVAAAKRLLRGVIGIDSEAGPTEILILADETAKAKFVAADLISQAEHDENAAAVLVTTSAELIHEVEKELENQVAVADNRARIEIALAGEQSALVLASSMDQAIMVANEYATEHLEIQTLDANSVADRITNAGAIFIGNFAPVSLGDYLAGSNHVLPTSQQAKFGPGLGVHSFLRPQERILYTSEALAEVTEKLDRFAVAEGLSAHGKAAKIRFDS